MLATMATKLYEPLSDWQAADSLPEGMYLANNDDPRWLLFHSAVANAHTDLKPAAPLFHRNYSKSDTSGLGYTFVGGSGDRVLKDSVRYYNDIITSWKKMLAQNELDKLNARALILSQIDNIDNLDELNPGGISDAADDNGAATSEIGLTSMGRSTMPLTSSRISSSSAAAAVSSRSRTRRLQFLPQPM